ncbi:MAG TPA: carboxypeptidase-like regulatory domain-containing protein [Candidatus Polarisedimenticolia bacterium]|nr:carboxypeptidase-like regulatory domain-containing protein [Candidatus Polarisedimenticolia bacterium]
MTHPSLRSTTQRGSPAARAVSLLTCAALLLAIAPPSLAANGSVRGRVAREDGRITRGFVVRATPLDGGPPVTAPIDEKGRYEFPTLHEGAYRFQVVGPDARGLGPGTTILVPPAPLDLDLKLTGSGATEVRGAAAAAHPPGRRPNWPLIGGAVAAVVAAGLIVCDRQASPSKPSICP